MKKLRSLRQREAVAISPVLKNEVCTLYSAQLYTIFGLSTFYLFIFYACLGFSLAGRGPEAGSRKPGFGVSHVPEQGVLLGVAEDAVPSAM